MPIDVAVVSPGEFAAATDRASSVERVAAETARRLPDRYQVTIYSRRTAGTASQARIDSVMHQRIRASSRMSYHRQVIKMLRQKRPDIIQIENRPFLARLYRRSFPTTPLILSLHSTTFINPRTYGGRALRSCLNCADRIAVNSEFLAKWIQDKLAIPQRKLYVCPPGVDASRFASKYAREGREQAELLREELGYQHKKIILFMGRLIPIKGVHHMLSALPAVIEEHDDAVLIICGSARYGSDRITRYVRSLHMQGNKMPRHVRFIPFVPHSMVPAWYQAADIAVVPSSGSEAFGLVNVEALACGTPVVSTRAGGIVEIVEHGVNGLLIEPSHMREQLARSITRLLSDNKLRERLGRQGVEHVHRHFTWERTAVRYAELYEYVMETDRRRKRKTS